MKHWRNVCMFAGLGLAGLLPAQVEPKAAGEGERTVTEWIRDLGSDSYKDRVAAERALRELGKDALPALEEAAAGSDDGEIKWRARRLVRQIESGRDPAALEPRGPQEPQEPRGGGALPRARDQFEDVFRRLERDFGIDVPRRHFFQDDFFKDLDAQFREMEQRMRDLQGQAKGMSQGFSMQVGPDGVRVEVQEKNDKGEVENKVYEAPDMETFQKQYGDLLKQNGLDLGRGLFGLQRGDDWGRGWRLPTVQVPHLDWDGQWRGLDRDRVEGALAPPPADGRERLGVMVRPEIPPAVREYLALDPDTGLMVESVQADTLAAALGLQAGDIVTAIGGANVGSPDDVHAALKEIEAGADVEVRFLRKGVAKTATAKKPAPPPPAEAPAGARIEPRRKGAGTIR